MKKLVIMLLCGVVVNGAVLCGTETIVDQDVRMLDVGMDKDFVSVPAMIQLELDENGEPVGIIGVTRLETAQLRKCLAEIKRAQGSQSLTAAEAFEALMEGVSDAVYGAGVLLYIGGKIVIPPAVKMTKAVWHSLINDYVRPVKNNLIGRLSYRNV